MSAVVGIDTNSFGFYWSSTVPLINVAYGTFGDITGVGDAQERRIDTFRRACRLFESLPSGSSVYVEEAIVLLKNAETTRKLVMMAATVEAAFIAANPDAMLHFVPISTWRKVVLGRGSGPKKVMKQLATNHVMMTLEQSGRSHQRMWFEENDNLAEAFCIMTYGEAVT